MVCRGSLLSPIALALAVQAAHGFGVYRVVTDGTLVPGAGEIQCADSSHTVTQTFTPPQEPIAGVELLVSRHPKTDPMDILIIVREGNRELGRGVMPIPSGTAMPVRLAFSPVVARGVVTIEAWAPQGRPGNIAGIQFYPVDHYRGGQLWVNGRPVRGDVIFRVLTPDSNRSALAPGVDFSGVPGRFPSENLAEAKELSQEFLVPMDSLVAVEFVAGTGGMAVGPPLGWELLLNGRTVRGGTVEAVYDNVPIRLAFPPLLGAEGLPLTLRLTSPGPGETRVWLCGRMPRTGALAVGDRMVDGSMVLTTLHLTGRVDSLRVVLASDSPLLPEPGILLAGSCVLTQSFLWPARSTAGDMVGLRLSLGEWTVPGSLVYQVRDEERRQIVHEDSIGLAGKGPNDYLWLPLGGAHRSQRLSVSVAGHGAHAETAARFWWMPADVYGQGEATGCVARPGGDCVFRLAVLYSAGRWMREFPQLAAGMAPGAEGAVALLLVARLGLIAFGIAVICVRRGGPGSSPSGGGDRPRGYKAPGR